MMAIMISGAQIDSERPRPATIRLSDIAAHLAKLCMYRGATHNFYSEAQHCTLLAAEVFKLEGAHAALYALLHSADSAVWMDSPAAQRPGVLRAVHEAIDLDFPAPQPIQRIVAQTHAQLEIAEMQQLLTGWDREARALVLAGFWPLPRMIKPQPWDKALDGFVDALRSYAVGAGIRPCPALLDIL